MPRTTLVLLPGLLNTRRVFEHQIVGLSDIADCIVPEPWHHDTIGAMAKAVLNSQPERFSIIAHAMGGFVAFEILRQAPERVASLALLSTLAPNDTPVQTARREGYLRLVEEGKFAGVVEERIPILLHPSGREDKSLVSAVRKMAEDTGPDVFLRQQRAIMTRPDSRPGLAAISCPTLILFARQDGIVTHEHQREMHEGIAGSRLEIIENCGHLMTMEHPELVSKILVDWIGGI